ncbi:MAG: acyltransferase [Sphingobacteriales bacterium]|nr:MAG: acyltransferase [Sphingobacteriales bacterium]
MSKDTSYLLKKSFGLRREMSMGFYLCDFLFRRLLRQNADTNWAVHHSSTIHSPKNIVKGINVYPGDSPGVYINANNGVRVGDYTNIGPNVGIISSNHDVIDNHRQVSAQPIEIGKYCWLGMGAIVLPEVTLGDFTIVGAGAVVTKSFAEGYCVIAGNPAKIIKQLDKEACNAFALDKKR